MALYDRYLAVRHRLRAQDVPDHVAVVLTERDLLEQGAYDRLESLLGWAFDYGSGRVTVSVSVLDEAVVDTLAHELAELDTPRSAAVRRPGDTEAVNTPIRINIGLGGRREFAAAVRDIADSVADDDLTPDEIDASDVEDRLVFPEEPDLLVKTGAERLSDFMIWQSVYSELYFTDVNWRDLRKRDYLRALLEYDRRNRRFGR